MSQDNKWLIVIIRWLKWIFGISSILCIVIYFLAQGIKAKYFGFRNLEKVSIDNAVLYKSEVNAADNRLDSIVLSENEIKSLIHSWKNSYPIGPCKFFPKFTLVVKMKYGRIRHFRINGDVIKEQRDDGFKFLFDGDFFENLWEKRTKKSLTF